MKNKLKKGFTIVELVIVIAVIAILAAVLIPTFSSITNSARESAALQEASRVPKPYLRLPPALCPKIPLSLSPKMTKTTRTIIPLLLPNARFRPLPVNSAFSTNAEEMM